MGHNRQRGHTRPYIRHHYIVYWLYYDAEQLRIRGYMDQRLYISGNYRPHYRCCICRFAWFICYHLCQWLRLCYHSRNSSARPGNRRCYSSMLRVHYNIKQQRRCRHMEQRFRFRSHRHSWAVYIHGSYGCATGRYNADHLCAVRHGMHFYGQCHGQSSCPAHNGYYQRLCRLHYTAE